MKYQIRFCDNKGNGHFKYVDVKSKEGVEEKAAQAATDYLKEQAQKAASNSSWNVFYVPERPKRTLHVWEWDSEKREPKRGGHRFKLRLAFIEATYVGGSKKRQEWYEPVIEDK